MKKTANVTGYIFPNMPERWNEPEKRFALGLRGLFDILFARIQSMSKEIEELKEQINEATEKEEFKVPTEEQIDKITNILNIQNFSFIYMQRKVFLIQL